MKVIKKLKIVFIIIVMMITFSSTSSYAQLEKYLYKNNDNKYNYILTKKVKSQSSARSHLHEVFTNSVAEFLDKIHDLDILDEIKELINGKVEPHITVKRYSLAVDEKGLGTDSYYYFWLEGVVNMVNYTLKDDTRYYNSYGNEKNENVLAAIYVLEACDTELGTFATKKNSLPSVMNELSDWIVSPDTNELSQKRSAYVYGKITKTGKGYQSKGNNNEIKDEFQKKCQQAKRELKAAYDYNNKTTKFGDNIWDDFDTKAKYNAEKIIQYWTDYGKRYNVGDRGEELEKIWEQIVGQGADEAIDDWDADADAADPAADYASSPPKVDTDVNTTFYMANNLTSEAKSGPSDLVNDAERFVDGSDSENYLKTENLQDFSQKLYSILLGIGIVLSVIIGLILGIKFMLASVAEKAEVKKLLVTYAIGCAVIFGAFGIWKLVVTIMQNI